MLEKIKHGISRILIYVYALLKNKKKKVDNEDTVIICFFGLLGDAIMFMDALCNLKEKLGNNPEGIFVVACRSSVMRIFQDAGFTEGIVYEEIDRSKFENNILNFRKSVDSLNKYNAGLLLHVRSSFVSEDVFIHAVECSRKVCVRGNDVIGKTSKYYEYFVNNTYDEIINAPDEYDQLTKYGLILKKILMEEYKSKIFKIPIYPPIHSLPSGSYLLVCPGASSLRKAWPADKFVAVINYFIDSCNFKIVLCGSANDALAGELIASNVTDQSRIVNLVGRSDLKEWFALVQNAGLVIANESGAIHVAAASGTPSVCIGAQEFGDSFLPYRPETIRDDDQLPIVVRCDKMKCFNCRQHRRHRDDTGKICYKKTGVFRCLDLIQVQQVTEAVVAVLKR